MCMYPPPHCMRHSRWYWRSVADLVTIVQVPPPGDPIKCQLLKPHVVPSFLNFGKYWGRKRQRGIRKFNVVNPLTMTHVCHFPPHRLNIPSHPTSDWITLCGMSGYGPLNLRSAPQIVYLKFASMTTDESVVSHIAQSSFDSVIWSSGERVM
jgi:hypothetical protein